MESKAPNLIHSGIEPVDRLLGGLESGQLYLVHGEAAGKSLFGIKFLIEGLKRGENGALVIRYSPEDAVRRFARLGYDCLEDLYNGRLVILEYSNELIEQGSRLRDLSPVLRALEWELGDSRPARLIFDPVNHLIAGEHDQRGPRVREFASWAGSFGATVVMVTDGDSIELVRDFVPLVRESFRFEVKDLANRSVRFLCFEKTENLADQQIEVDPSRGVFLVGRQSDDSGKMFHLFSPAHLPSHEITPAGEPPETKSEEKKQEPRNEIEVSMDEAPVKPAEVMTDSDLIGLIEVNPPSSPPSVEPKSPLIGKGRTGSLTRPATGSLEEAQDVFSDLLEDLAELAPVLEHQSNVPKQPPLPLSASAQGSTEPKETPEELSEHKLSAFKTEPQEILAPITVGTGDLVSPLRASSADAAVEETVEAKTAPAVAAEPPATVAARTVEMLLRPPDAQADSIEPRKEEAVKPGDFNVLVIDDDPATCELLADSLAEFNVETVHDGVTGLARLISFKPDLVIIDVDLPVVDGFKVLAHIRASLNTPIIVVSGKHVRASDRVLSAELGADYYLTKPFSIKELKQKARQLVARYRGINSWIVTPAPETEQRASIEKDQSAATSQQLADAAPERFTSYREFAARVDKQVRGALEGGQAFSIVGCRVPEMTSNGGRRALKLFELIEGLVRDADAISTNPRNDLVILLSDADTEGAQAFVSRLREKVTESMSAEPATWMRSFPGLEESSEEKLISNDGGDNNLNRRASDKSPGRRPAAEAATARAGRPSGGDASMRSESSTTRERRDPRKAYIDFLEQL